MTESWAYQAANTIEITGDLTSKYRANQLIRIVQAGSTKFFIITAVALVSGNTRLTVSAGGVYTLTNDAITSHAFNDTIPPELPFALDLKAKQSQIDHGSIGGLGDDDHPQYLQTAGGGTIATTIYLASAHPYVSTFVGFVYYPHVSQHVAYYKKTGGYEFYWRSSDTGYPGGANEATLMGLNSDGSLYITNDCSALTFTDRTDAFVGNALEAIKKIAATVDGKIDHATLPEFARAKINKGTDPDDPTKIIEEDGRDIGAMVSVLTVAVQQLVSLIEERDAQIAKLEARLATIEKKVFS